MREGVVPTVDVQRTVLHRPHRVFPLVTGLDRRALHDATTREAEHARFQGLQCLRQIGTQAIGTIVERMAGEERDMLQIQCARCLHRQAQAGFQLRCLGL